jgi:hypothetical protein
MDFSVSSSSPAASGTTAASSIAKAVEVPTPATEYYFWILTSSSLSVRSRN